MNPERPYHVTLGPNVMSAHATFAEALDGFRKYAHLNHAHLVNWVAADIDFDGLTEDECEAVGDAHNEAWKARRAK